jgi:chromosome segregation ATPase
MTLSIDPYKWSYLSERKHLFEKPLSKLNTGAYREICATIGHSIEVRRQDNQTSSDTSSNQRSTLRPTDESEPPITPTFTSTIEALRQRNELISIRVQSLETTIERRNQLVTTLQRQCETLKGQLGIVHTQLDCCQKQLRKAEQLYTDSETSRVKVQEKVSRCRDAADDLLTELQSESY